MVISRQEKYKWEEEHEQGMLEKIRHKVGLPTEDACCRKHDQAYIQQQTPCHCEFILLDYY